MYRKNDQNSALCIRQAAATIESYAPQLRKRFSQRAKAACEKAYATLACHAAKLSLPISRLSTGFDIEQYVDAARNLLEHLARFEYLAQQPPPPLLGNPAGMEEILRWSIQPALSPEINYLGFQMHYGFERAEIEVLVAQLKKLYPRLPVQNRVVEWAVRNLREMEAQHLSSFTREDLPPRIHGAHQTSQSGGALPSRTILSLQGRS